ncbi:MAG: site-specific integrase [Acidobacteriia bacterium]|nr:site-specific integrase [Terriglobia bacterium]
MGSVYRPKYKDRHGQERTSSLWWIAYYQNGRLIRESTETADYDAAKDILKTREGDVAKGLPVLPKHGRVLFSELTADVILDYEINDKKSLADLKRRIKLHLAPVFGERRAATIKTSEIREYIGARRNEGAKNATINRELAIIKRAFSLAVNEGRLLFRPKVPMLQEDNVRKGFFERKAFDSLLKHLNDDLKPIFQFAFLTGWRVASEILPLQWQQVDFEAATVRLEPGTTKSGAGRTFPLTSELRDLLEGQSAKNAALRQRGIICPWVFNRRGRRIKSVKTAWNKARTAAGLPGRIQHDFRRTAIRNLIRAGVSEKVAMQICGHKTRSVFDRYNIVDERDYHDAARMLDEAGPHSKTHSKSGSF